MNDVKDFVKDKTISVESGTVNTGKVKVDVSRSAGKAAGYAAVGVYKTAKVTGKTAVKAGKSMAGTATSLTVQRAPDVFRRTDDLSDTVAKRAGTEVVRGLRITNQVRHSLLNSYHSHFYEQNQKFAKNSRGAKAVHYSTRGDKHRAKIDRSKSFSLKRSTKATFNNQVRRQLYSFSGSENFENKVIGKTTTSVWRTWRYRRQVKTLAVKTVSLVTSAIGAVVALVTSIPAMIASIVSVLPVIVIIIVIAVVLAPFCDLTYKGRIGELIDNVYELNQIYGVEFDPVEMLCITDTLGWSHADYEDYEILCSIVLDQKKDNKVSFEQMQDNVFSKYNPAKKYKGNQIYSDNENTGWFYYSHSGIDMSIIIGGSDKKNINYKDMMTVYPDYNKLKTPETKDAYGSDANIAFLKQTCSDKYAYNEEVYLEYLSTSSNFQSGNSEVGNKIAKVAISQSGKRYWWGKAGPDYYDCSGLVIYAHEKCGIANAGNGRWTTKTLLGAGIQIKKEELQPGDIILFSSNGSASGVHHVGIYIGNNTMIHASGQGSSTVGQDPNQCVKESSLDSPYYAREAYQYRRLY